MPHNHQHSCTCPHASVKYCAHCQVVHCLDCNQEWSKRTNWSWTLGTQTVPYYQGGYTTYPVTSGDWQKTAETLLSTCSHGG